MLCACDGDLPIWNCAHPSVLEDRTKDAIKLLFCIAKTQQRFGMKHVIDVLRGAQTPGEIRGRAERLHRFEELNDVQMAVQKLMQKKQLDEEMRKEFDQVLRQYKERYAAERGGPSAVPVAAAAK